MSLLFEKKLISLLLAILLLFEATIIWPDSVGFISILSLVLIAVSLFFLLHIRPKEKESYPIFILPLVLVLEIPLVIVTIPSDGLRQLFLFSACFLLYLVIFSLEAIKAKIESYAVIIFNILTIGNLIAAFLGYVLIYDIYLKESLSSWVGMVLVSLATFLYFLFSIWQNDVLKKRGYIYLMILIFLMIELFWVVALLPLLSIQAGFILFLGYYVLADPFVSFIRRNFSKKKTLNHITIPAIVLMFLLVSAGF